MLIQVDLFLLIWSSGTFSLLALLVLRLSTYLRQLVVHKSTNDEG